MSRPRIHAWPPDAGDDPLGVIEQDVRGLLWELAVCRHALAEQRRTDDARARKHLLALLDVLDGFDGVFASVQAKEADVTRQMRIWLGNFRTVRRLLGNALQDEGVVALDSFTRTFDPATHRAVDTLANPGQDDGTIMEERQRGYGWRREILRKAEVVVVRNELDDNSEEG